MKAYKGFDKDMKCRGFQFEEGKEYEHDGDVKCCESGFHACEYPLDCLAYYEPSKSVYHEVELDGTIDREDDSEDTKVAAKKIKIGAKLDIGGLVKGAIDFTFAKAKKVKTSHTKADYSATSATGYGSANSATGDRSANSATGYGSANVTTGVGSINAGGEANICVGWGKDNKCKGLVGCYLVLSEWGNWDGKKYPLIGAQMVLVDGKNIKEDTYYELKNGEIKEVDK